MSSQRAVFSTSVSLSLSFLFIGVQNNLNATFAANLADNMERNLKYV